MNKVTTTVKSLCLGALLSMTILTSCKKDEVLTKHEQETLKNYENATGSGGRTEGTQSSMLPGDLPERGDFKRIKVSQAKGAVLFERAENIKGFILKDYIQVIDLDLATISFMQQPAGRNVVIGGVSTPGFNTMSLMTKWTDIANSGNSKLFSINNGSMFQAGPNPTGIATPLKMNGMVLTQGYGQDQKDWRGRGMLRMLAITSDKVASIRPYTDRDLASIANHPAPNIIVGVAAFYSGFGNNKSMNYLSVSKDGKKLYIYHCNETNNGPAAVKNLNIHQRACAAINMYAGGGTDMMHFNSGTGTQLISGNLNSPTEYVRAGTPRAPQALVVYAD